ncbi:MAG: VOC family protein [Spirochaetes bacterium]|jgi:predicted enzyme related to lactoylglutathione lyase|nr:VOC family protein [Spirochaetota bacterium]
MIIIEKLYNISFAVSNLENAISFYKDIFGFDIVEWQSGSKEVCMQMGDINLRLCEVEKITEPDNSENYVTFYVDEDDFDDALDEIDENNITVIYGPENIRSGRRILVLDPDGNRLGLTTIN